MFRTAGNLIFHACDEGSLVYAEDIGVTCMLGDAQVAFLRRIEEDASTIDAPEYIDIVQSLLDAGLIIRC